jgi:Na+-transporting methylmalonyl-CoA/oxaloacetate decarboxylase gamma subunit
MKRFVFSILALSVLAVTGCSRSEEKTAVQPQSTPDAARLKSDSERLQQATANAAKEREKAASQATPSPSATP